VSKRQAQLASLQQQVTQMQAQVARLASYEQFEKLAQARAETVQEIASTRFDWYQALSDLSKVVPAHTSLQALVATASPTSTTGGSSAASSSGGVRGDINAPAFTLKGCTASQDEVAQIMSRLRLINGVTRVTLEDSTAPGTTQSSVTTSSASGSAQPGCPAHGPTFDMVVFFQPLPGAASSTSGQTVSTSTTGAAK
jgi:Tfp pilus assembly protein PilN